MHTITTKVSDDINNRLEFLSKTIDRNKSYLLRKAIESFLEEKEDYLIALHRLEQNGARISLEALEKECGCDAGHGV
jgi:RHH-type rel operon transcriptional repressor/antitoxin RelB